MNIYIKKLSYLYLGAFLKNKKTYNLPLTFHSNIVLAMARFYFSLCSMLKQFITNGNSANFYFNI